MPNGSCISEVAGNTACLHRLTAGDQSHYFQEVQWQPETLHSQH